MEPRAIREYLRFAIATAELAGQAILPYFRAGVEVENKDQAGGYDPVTAADRAAERLMRDRIRQSYPDHAISGEEFGADCTKDRLTWFIDPLDGTRSFVVGLLHWGTMIALSESGTPVLGVVHQPFIGEWFIGTILGEAQCQRGERKRCLATRHCASIGEATIGTSDPIRFTRPQDRMRVDKLSRRVRDVHHGAECVGACMLASGQLDAILEVDLDAHDVMPLVPIVEAAGGVITDWEGRRRWDGGNILICGDAALHAALLEVLANA